MSDELQKISHGTTRAVITSAACPEREPTFNKGATGKEVVITVDSVEYHIPTEERLATGDASPTASETITSGSDIVGVLGDNFLVLPPTSSLTEVLDAIDVSINSLAGTVGDFVTLTTDQEITGEKTFANNVIISENKQVSFEDIGGDYKAELVSYPSKFGAVGWDSTNVIDYAPAINTTNWDDLGDFVVGSGSAVYTHSSGSGTISFNGWLENLPRSVWAKITYTITGETGSASSFIMKAYGNSKNLTIEDGTFEAYIFTGNSNINNGEGDVFTLEVTSTLSGAFTISVIKIEVSEQTTLQTSTLKVSSLRVSASDSADSLATSMVGQIGDGNDFNQDSLTIGNIGNNQEYYMLLDNSTQRITLNADVNIERDVSINGDGMNMPGSASEPEELDTLVAANWNDSGDFVIGINLATYTHSSGVGVLDTAFLSGFINKWCYISFEITSNTGLGDEFEISINGESFLATVGDHIVSTFIESLDTFTLSASSAGAGSFVIQNISLVPLVGGVLNTGSVQLANINISPNATGQITSQDIARGSLKWTTNNKADDISEISIEAELISHTYALQTKKRLIESHNTSVAINSTGASSTTLVNQGIVAGVITSTSSGSTTLTMGSVSSLISEFLLAGITVAKHTNIRFTIENFNGVSNVTLNPNSNYEEYSALTGGTNWVVPAGYCGIFNIFIVASNNAQLSRLA